MTGPACLNAVIVLRADGTWLAASGPAMGLFKPRLAEQHRRTSAVRTTVGDACCPVCRRKASHADEMVAFSHAPLLFKVRNDQTY
ncbi:hypothetical protein [Rhodopila sp.]|uniref:hypothetical protein n=1 Tax=Rhodopila sp. TaxID=2480087 RepID=UPI003D0E1D99